MRTILPVLGIFLLLSIMSTAQPVITGANKLKAGDWYRTQEAQSTGVVAGSSGINQTWNYSGLVNRTGFLAYDSVAMTGGVPIPSVFSAANLMVYSSSFEPGSSYTSYNFLKTTGDTVRNMGSYSGNINETTSYQPPYTLFPYFPYTYDSYNLVNTQERAVYTGGFITTTNYEIDYLVTGHGTLILPGNRTFTNVLQIERIFYTINPVFGYLQEESLYIVYMAEGIPLPLLEMDVDINNGAVNFARYMTSYGRAAIGPTYTFTGNGNWNNPANWQGGIMPPANITSGSSIVISHAPGGSCIINVPVTIPPGVQFIVSAGANLVLPGNLTIQ